MPKNKEQPWQKNWEKKKALGSGGQGITFLVTRKSDKTSGVLKLLKYGDNEQARGRMAQEARNLQVLNKADCKVPAVLETNADQFENSNVQLFMIMEYIEGQTLADAIDKGGRLSLQAAASIAFDLSGTVQMALEYDVIHRDLKPENIIVRAIEPADLVVVDYGLSFRPEDDLGGTQSRETLDNDFLSLPERRVHGGDRRDARSEFTYICAILYYCITKHRPVDLVDGSGRLPHQRPGHTVAEALPNEERVKKLEVFLDRGLALDINSRFPSITNLQERLHHVIDSQTNNMEESPNIFAANSRLRLLKNDRVTQLAAYREYGKKLLDVLQKVYSEYQGDMLKPYKLLTAKAPQAIQDIEGTDKIGCHFLRVITVDNHKDKVYICYQLCAKGPECGIYRALLESSTENSSRLAVVERWEPLLWYNDNLKSDDIRQAVIDFRAYITKAMKHLEQTLLNKNVDQK